ncbi:MAG: serine/threonine protein kinase [Blautia sp.]|nr:serine/threonine protein kinase [Blautia sp.]MDY5030437.1 serine/threonine-protein kinase [Blautia sp.]
MNVEKICINCMQEKPHNSVYCPHCGFCITEYKVNSHHLPPLTLLDDRYLLGRVIGEGGFGITYVALDFVTGEKVAIKELFVADILVRRNTRTVLPDGDVRKKNFYYECKMKFLQEADLLNKMRDKKGVVDIYRFFEANNTAYIVMEFLEGIDLLTYVKAQGGKISLEEAFRLLAPVMKSLMEIHRLGVYHRDISPDNIRCLKDGSIKIMDFGGAKYNYNEISSKYITLKQGYAPPEQYSCGYKIGPWIDVYEIGATFYRCITGKVPVAAMERTMGTELERPGALGVQITAEQEAVLMKALALQTEERFGDMKEFYDALKKSLCEEETDMDAEYQRLLEILNQEKPVGFWKYLTVWSCLVLLVVCVIVCFFWL